MNEEMQRLIGKLTFYNVNFQVKPYFDRYKIEGNFGESYWSVFESRKNNKIEFYGGIPRRIIDKISADLCLDIILKEQERNE